VPLPDVPAGPLRGRLTQREAAPEPLHSDSRISALPRTPRTGCGVVSPFGPEQLLYPSRPYEHVLYPAAKAFPTGFSQLKPILGLEYRRE